MLSYPSFVFRIKGETSGEIETASRPGFTSGGCPLTPNIRRQMRPLYQMRGRFGDGEDILRYGMGVSYSKCMAVHEYLSWFFDLLDQSYLETAGFVILPHP